MQWIMIADQYILELHYIQGSKSIAVDALNCLGLETSSKSEPDPTDKENHKLRLLEKAFAFTPAEEQSPSPKNSK